MGTQEEKKKVIQQISDQNSIDGFSAEKTQEMLSIVYDAINSVISGVMITDVNGNICFVNPAFCKMFDYNQQEIIGENAAKLFTAKEVRKFSDVISIIDISKNEVEEFIVQKSGGTTFAVEVSAFNITSAANQISGRMASFLDITSKKEIENDRERLIGKLQNALDTIKTLRGIIPICSYCKKIRDDKGAWEQMEAYISEHSEAHFSHGCCPECFKKAMKEMQ